MLFNRLTFSLNITGKYTHAACFPLQVAFTDENNQRYHAASAMVTNFTKPTPEKPSLLKFDEVILFHSFIHSFTYSFIDSLIH
jgi:metallopeptidase MepB